LTLKVWAAFTGDALGPSSLAAMEAYLRRSLATQPNKTRKALEQMAAQMMLNAQGTVDFHTAGNWLGGADMAQVELDEDNPNQPAPGRGKGKGKLPEKARSRGSLPGLIESGVVQAHDERALRLVSPVLLGYLAAQGLAGARAGEQIAAQTEWSGKSSTLTYLACIDQDDGWLEAAIKDDKLDITLSGLLNAGRRLQTVPDGQPWIAGVLRQLAVALQKDRLPMALKARIITALALANANGINLLLRQLSSSPVPNLRQLAALGLGMMKDAKSLGDLLRLQQEPNPLVNRAAILALVAMGDKGGLEAVATQLLTGDDSERCAAAEALANHPEEGYPTLEEAADVSDPTVRRAAVFGLARTRQTWAIALLKKLRAEDTQWIVQDTANQMLTALEDSHPRQPHPLPELTQTAWLLAFAAERGLAVPPGRPAVEMLLRALKEGSDEQRQAAAYYLSRRPDAKAIAPLYQLYFSQGGDVHEYAWETLWSHAADGIPLPPPAQFDYR
jgi:HEAT repeat protein